MTEGTTACSDSSVKLATQPHVCWQKMIVEINVGAYVIFDCNYHKSNLNSYQIKNVIYFNHGECATLLNFGSVLRLAFDKKNIVMSFSA
jgi:hypothetical protein